MFYDLFSKCSTNTSSLSSKCFLICFQSVLLFASIKNRQSMQFFGFLMAHVLWRIRYKNFKFKALMFSDLFSKCSIFWFVLKVFYKNFEFKVLMFSDLFSKCSTKNFEFKLLMFSDLFSKCSTKNFQFVLLMIPNQKKSMLGSKEWHSFDPLLLNRFDP